MLESSLVLKGFTSSVALHRILILKGFFFYMEFFLSYFFVCIWRGYEQKKTCQMHFLETFFKFFLRFSKSILKVWILGAIIYYLFPTKSWGRGGFKSVFFIFFLETNTHIYAQERGKWVLTQRHTTTPLKSHDNF